MQSTMAHMLLHTETITSAPTEAEHLEPTYDPAGKLTTQARFYVHRSMAADATAQFLLWCSSLC